MSGGGQTARAGTDLPQPFVVEAQGADNLPVPGTSISFRSVTAGGSVTPASPRITDAAGRASVMMTLGNSAGSYQYEAASGALTPVTVTQTATQPSPAAIAIVSGNAQTDSTGGILALPFVVRVTDAFNAPVSGVTVQWARLSGSGTLGSASSTTAADGTASTTYTLGQTLGSDVVSATVPTVVGPTGTVQFTVTTIARGAGQIAITAGGGQSGGPGSTLPSQVTARVADVNGTPLPGKTVNWTASGNGATFNPASQLTDAAGLVSTTVTLGSSLGTVTITATSGALVATTTANVVVGAPASIQKSGDNQSATVGTAVSVPPSVTITDLAGNPVPGVNVTFAVSGGGGSATGTSATTNGAGVATVGSWTLGPVAGANSLTATAGSLTAVFSATGVSGSGTVIAFVTQPSSSASSGVALATQPVFQLKDALGNHVLTAGIVVTASITSGSGSLANCDGHERGRRNGDLLGAHDYRNAGQLHPVVCGARLHAGELGNDHAGRGHRGDDCAERGQRTVSHGGDGGCGSAVGAGDGCEWQPGGGHSGDVRCHHAGRDDFGRDHERNHAQRHDERVWYRGTGVVDAGHHGASVYAARDGHQPLGEPGGLLGECRGGGGLDARVHHGSANDGVERRGVESAAGLCS